VPAGRKSEKETIVTFSRKGSQATYSLGISILFVFVLASGGYTSAASKDTVPACDIRISLKSIGAACADFLTRNKVSGYKDCGITDSGLFGNSENGVFHFVLYCIIPDHDSNPTQCGDDSFTARYHSRRGLAIYRVDPETGSADRFLERVDPEIGVVLYEKPRIMENSYGKFMDIPIRIEGTGVGNISEYYRQDPEFGKWERLVSDEWAEGLEKRLPPGLSIRKGIWPDITSMTVETGLYRENDPNCCPSGGTAEMILRLEGNRIVLKSIRFDTTPDDK
jgi:hypothetical protein